MPKSQDRHKALLLLRHHNGATGEIRSPLERRGDRRGKRIPDLASVIGFSYKFNAKDRIERGTRRTGRLWRRKLGRRELRRNTLRRCSGPRVIACYHSASRCSPTRTARFNSHVTLRWSFDPVPPKVGRRVLSVSANQAEAGSGQSGRARWGTRGRGMLSRG